MGLTLRDARNLSVAEYMGLFTEFEYRNERDNKSHIEPPSEELVAQQMALMREMGVRMH